MSRHASLIAVFVLLFPISLAAQSNEIGIFVSSPRFDSTSLADDEELGLDIRAEFDEDIGYAASYNRFWTDRFSTEFALHSLGADTTITASDGIISQSIDVGELDLTALTAVAQWHFARSSRFSPYVGAGVSYITGEAEFITDFDDPSAPTETVDLESATGFVANAGVNIGITPSVSIALDGKYLLYEAEVDAEDSLPLQVDPLVFSVGVKFRF